MNGQNINWNWLDPNIPVFEPEGRLIFEHPDWVKNRQVILDPRYFQSFYNIISGIADANYQCNQIHIGNCGNVSVVFFTKNINNTYIIFLCTPAINNVINNNYNNLAENNELEKLTMNAQRAYPYYFLADVDLWYEIQKGTYEGVDLALSPEEIMLLANVRLPVFITGLAGSGKSTMLVYIFSKYLLRKILQPQNYPEKILFLTYSKSLRDVMVNLAKRFVRLNLHVQNQLGQNNQLSSQQIELIENSFYTFSDFLQSILNRVISSHEIQIGQDDLERITGLLDETKLLSFAKVREKFITHPAGGLSFELLWYIFRTYIKGQSIDEDITEFDQIPQQEMQNLRFNENQFCTALQWIKANFGQNHDILDLVKECHRWVIRYPQIFGNYAVIFCDEAQDFTPVEIEFIIRLSHFVVVENQNLNMNLPNIPFALAGDPSQSLNPTGFDWTKIRTTFYTKLVKAGIKIQQGQMAENAVIARLQMNYRSTPSIAKFSNFIQLARITIFGNQRPPYNEITPQKVFRTAEDEKVKLVKITDNNRNRLENCLRETQVILPCELEGEDNYINGDDILRNIYNNSKNFYNVYYTKGLEWDAVVLYKWFSGRDNLQNNAYDNEYFFTKFYVAATRAKRKLYIIDTTDGVNILKQFLENFEMTNIPQQWHSVLEEFDFYEVVDDIPEYIPTANEYLVYAERLLETAMDNNDIEQFKRAEWYFTTSMGKQDFDRNRQTEVTQKITFCKAKIEELQGNYPQAGEYYLQINNQEEAFHCFFLGKQWERIANYQGILVGVLSVYYCLARFMINQNMDTVSEALDSLINGIRQNNNRVRRIISTPVFDEIISSILNFCKNNENDLVGNVNYVELFKGFGGQLPRYKKDFISLAARLQFRNNNFQEAKRLWDEVLSEAERNTAEYYYCCAMIAEQLEDKIDNFLKAADFPGYRERIIQIINNENFWRINNIRDLSDGIFNRMVQLLENSGRHRDVFLYLLERGEISEAIDFISEHNFTYDERENMYQVIFELIETTNDNNQLQQFMNQVINNQECRNKFIERIENLTRDRRDINKKFYSLFVRVVNRFSPNLNFTLFKKFSELFEVGELRKPDNFDSLFNDWLNHGYNCFEILEILMRFLDPYDGWRNQRDITDEMLFKDEIEKIIDKCNEEDKEDIKRRYFNMLTELKENYKGMDVGQNFITSLESKISGLAQVFGYSDALQRSVSQICEIRNINECIGSEFDIPDGENKSFTIKVQNNTTLLVIDWIGRKSYTVNTNERIISCGQENFQNRYTDENGRIEIEISDEKITLKFLSGNVCYIILV